VTDGYVERIKGFRYPAPGSRPHANIPIRESEDGVYDVKYYSRDPRNVSPQVCRLIPLVPIK